MTIENLQSLLPASKGLLGVFKRNTFEDTKAHLRVRFTNYLLQCGGHYVVNAANLRHDGMGLFGNRHAGCGSIQLAALAIATSCERRSHRNWEYATTLPRSK